MTEAPGEIAERVAFKDRPVVRWFVGWLWLLVTFAIVLLINRLPILGGPVRAIR